MILIEATIKYSGIDPDELKLKSHKRVCCSCDQCGRVRWVNFKQYRDLCKSCSGKNKILSDEAKRNIGLGKLGNKNPMYGMGGNKNPFFSKHHSDETKEKMSKSRKNYFKNNPNINSGDKNPNWKGGTAGDRSHLLTENACTKLNDRFIGSDGHHVTGSVMIFIPSYIHKINHHNLKNGCGMVEINKLALNYLMGEI